MKIVPSPKDILAWVSPFEDLKLLLLLTYFFSLRPQEAFCLTRNSFLAGEAAANLECSKIMRAADLFDRLVVKIDAQRSQKIGITKPKVNSVGVVCCFNEKAAREIIQMIKGRKRNEYFFPYGNDWYYKKWRRHGYPNLTLKDCRRASLYWLGHHSNLDIVALKNHARHTEISTTSLYTRRPESSFSEFYGDLNLD